jgi:hypothetical protein
MDEKNAKSPDEQIVQDMNKGNLSPIEKALDETYLDPLSFFSVEGKPKKKLKRTGFGITRKIKQLGELMFRFENGDKTLENGEKVEPLSDKEEKQLEKELIKFFKDTLTPLTNEESESYGFTEFIYIRRAIEMRQARANGVSPEEYVRNEGKDRELNYRGQVALRERAIKALEDGDKDFIIELNKTKEILEEQ